MKKKYKIFTYKYDEVISAEKLENDSEITKLRKNLDHQLTNLQNLVTKLANKLQRQLLAKQNTAPHLLEIGFHPPLYRRYTN